MNATEVTAWWHDFSPPATSVVISACTVWLVTIILFGGGLKCCWVMAYVSRARRVVTVAPSHLPMTLTEQVEVLKFQLELSGTVEEVVHQAASQLLVVEVAGQPLVETAGRCIRLLMPDTNSELALDTTPSRATQDVERLHDGPADALRFGRRIMVVAARIMIASTLIGSVTVPVLVAFGLPFGVVTVPMVIGFTVGGIACGDPTQPRFVRELSPFCAIGGWLPVVAWAAFSAVLDIAATFPGATIAMRIVFNSGFAIIAIVWASMCIYGLPTIFPARDGLLARVGTSPLEYNKVIREQRAALEAAGYQRNMLWEVLMTITLYPIPAQLYLLEGADFFEMPVRAMIRRCLFCAKMAWMTTGVSLVAMSVAAHGSLPTAINWGGIFPTGLAFMAMSCLCTPAGHRTIRSQLGGLSSVDVQRRAVLVEFLSLLDETEPPARVV